MTKINTRVAPIPRGFRAITPHITTNNVSTAVELYKAAFGATIESVDTVPNTDVVVFAQVKVNNSTLTIGQGEAFGSGYVSLHHYVEDADATWAAALSAGFTELKALEETYWGDRMGLLVDPLGVRWSIGQRVMRLTAEERDERAKSTLGYPVQAPQSGGESTASDDNEDMPVMTQETHDTKPVEVDANSPA